MTYVKCTSRQPIPATLVRPLIAVASTAFAHCSFGVPASIRHSSVPIILVWKSFRKKCRLREQVATCQIVAKEANNLSKEGDTFPNRPKCKSKYDNQRQSTQSGNHVDLSNKSESARSKTPTHLRIPFFRDAGQGLQRNPPSLLAHAICDKPQTDDRWWPLVGSGLALAIFQTSANCFDRSLPNRSPGGEWWFELDSQSWDSSWMRNW